MKAELFTIATEPTAGLARLQKSLAAFGVPITLLGQGNYYAGHCWRWKTFISAARSSQADVVIHCDAYDSICLATLDEMLNRFASLAHPIVFSCWPSFGPGLSRVLNPGLMMAQRETLVSVFNDELFDTFFPDHFNDETQINSLHGWNPGQFKADEEEQLFHIAGPGSAALMESNGRLVNASGVSPCFVHGPNRWDISDTADWLDHATAVTPG